MRPPGTPHQLQKRRELAVQLLRSGKSLSAVARAVSASASSVWRWRQAYEQSGLKGLQAQPIPGRRPSLSTAQKRALPRILLAGPVVAGYKTDLWTLQRIRTVIRKRFGVSYHIGHVWKIVIGLGWSCQKPERRALQRDERDIAHWKRYRWPQIRRRADALGAHLVFLDESGFLLIPNLKRTWAPKGQTPTVSCQFSRAKLSVISALAVSPKRKRIALYMRFLSRNVKGPNVKHFLQQLLKQLRGPVILLWDRGPIHQHHEVDTFREVHPRLQVEDFPGYAPELNPAEYVWCQTDSALANGAPEVIAELKATLTTIKRRMSNSQGLLWACIYASDLPWKD